MAFARENILSGHGPQLPTFVVPQNGSPVKQLTLVSMEDRSAPLDCVAALSAQDSATYEDWAATGGSVVAGARDLWCSETPAFAVACTAVDASAGTFQFQVPITGTAESGIFHFEASLFNRDNLIIAINAGYIEVQPSLSASHTLKTPISVHLIRSRLRDAHPSANSILEECEFSLEEIYGCIQESLADFNDMAPNIGSSFTATTFPWPYRLADCVASKLLDRASIWYARNNMSVQAAGLNADDMNKAGLYAELAQKRRQIWEDWAKMQKRTMNIEAGWGTVRSRAYYR